MANASSPHDIVKQLATFEERFSSLKPELELTVRDPDLDVEGYVVVWSTLAAVGGPLGRCGKGGTRITPHVSLEEVGMLARIMTLKNAAAGLPLGGAKSGLKANPDEPGFEMKYRRFTQLVKPILVERGGIFGGLGFDIGARPEHPVWACQEFGTRRGFTGKPLSMGGTDYDREGIAGLGVATAAKTLLECDRIGAEGARFSVQGLGAMGAAVIRYFSEYGGVLAAFSDPRIGGTVRLTKPPSPELIQSIAHQDFQRTTELLQGEPRLPLEQILSEEALVFFPCAVQDVVQAGNQSLIKTKYLVEGANNPCSDEARILLENRGVHILPDFVANPGGIIAAFVEMTYEDSPKDPRAKVEEAKTMTRKKISENIRTLVELTSNSQLSSVQAGRYLAFKNIFRSPPG